jgi:Glycosyl hydrolase family 30 beta sandwich domain
LAQSEGNYVDRIAFVNPDGTVMLELLNANASPSRIKVAVDEQGFSLEMPAESLATLLVVPGEPAMSERRGKTDSDPEPGSGPGPENAPLL